MLPGLPSESSSLRFPGWHEDRDKQDTVVFELRCTIVSMMTASEQAFESFCSDNNFVPNRINEEASPRPDYWVEIKKNKLVFEIKELDADRNFVVVNEPSSPRCGIYSRTVGEHVRKRIHRARKQIQFAASQGLPSILLIYNNLDPLHLFGTEDHDFLTGMYGELTLQINKLTRQKAGEPFYGKNQYVNKSKNTSFSAVGRLAPSSGKMTVTLFENVFAKVRIAYEQLPPCFDVRRIEIC